MIITNSQLRKVINEELQIVLVEQQMELWEQRTTRELDKLLSEVDLKGAASAAIEKINNFVHTAGVKAWQFMQKGKEAAMKGVKALSGVLRRIQSFCEKRPRVCGAAKVFLTVMIMAGIVIVTTGAAQAAPESGGNPMVTLNLTPEEIDQVIGAAKIAMKPINVNPGDAGGFQSFADQISEYIGVVNELRSARGVPVEDLSKHAQKILSVGLEVIQDRGEQLGVSYPGMHDLRHVGSQALQQAEQMFDIMLSAAQRGEIGVSGPAGTGLGPK